MKKSFVLSLCFLASILFYKSVFSQVQVFDVNVINPIKLSSDRTRIVGGNLLFIEDGDVTGQTGCLNIDPFSDTQVIIEFFSCSAKAPEGQAIIFGLETAREETCSGPFQYYLPVTPPALSTTANNINLSASQQVRITVNQGGFIRFTATRTGGTTGTVEVNCFADGFTNVD